jgi:hypothetical protein
VNLGVNVRAHDQNRDIVDGGKRMADENGSEGLGKATPDDGISVREKVRCTEGWGKAGRFGWIAIAINTWAVQGTGDRRVFSGVCSQIVMRVNVDT